MATYEILTGMRVEAGEGEDHDAGRVLEIDGNEVTVGWDSGVRTTQPADMLRPEGEEAYAMATYSVIDLTELTWTVAPADRGQIVEVAYAADWKNGLLLRRTVDRSGPETTYSAADADSLRGEWQPHSEAPEVDGDWRPVVVRG